jgi:putative tryptophan/tyrosine transport system substrate-binding protein
VNRREVIAGLSAGAALALPRDANAQQPGRVPRVAYVTPNTRTTGAPFAAAFAERLRELGWIEDRTVAIRYEWGDGRSESTVERVIEFVQLKVDVIVTHGVPNILAAKQASATIPIVFALATDPVGSGFVASLARPGGNLTGLSIQSPDLGAKRLQLLREVIPALRRLAVLGDPGSGLEADAAVAAGRALGFEVAAQVIRSAEDLGPAFAAFEGHAEALYVCAVPLLNTNRAEINRLALARGLPTAYGFREAVEAGALMSYGPSILHLFRRCADYVDKILRGAKPADLPVQQPTKFELVINIKTARALGLDIPPSLLARADEVIE